MIKDNHYTFPFIPNVYMVIHPYEQDEAVMKDINNKIFEILGNVGAKCEGNLIKISANDIRFEYVSRIINRY